MLQLMDYEEARPQMSPGDLIAFGGKGGFSDVIKTWTRSPVSHVGCVAHTRMAEEGSDRYFNMIVESTSLQGFDGVIMRRLSDAIEQYDGDVWWLPLSQLSAREFNHTKFFNYVYQHKGKKYDMKQAILSAVDALEAVGIGKNEEDFGRFFCSELVAGAYEAAGIVPEVNASEITPIELCTWDIYSTTYYQLKGEFTRIPGAASREPLLS